MWKVGEFAKLVGVSTSTLRRWESENRVIPERTLGNQRVYSEKHLAQVKNLKQGSVAVNAVIYCRVSSSNQKEDLSRQIIAMEQFCLSQGVSITEVISEIGGGLNFKRPKFLKIIRSAIAGEIKFLYVAHKDRLCRFGFELVEQIIQWGGGEIIVANAQTFSPQEELTADLLSIIHCFSSRLYGLRKYKTKVKKIVDGIDPCKESDILKEV
jgi:predicted site-specific integrase-resolvase